MAVPPSNSGQKVNVFIRVRPLIQREKDAEETVNWYTDDKLIQQYQPGTKKLLLTAAPYAFDQIFSESATTENVYETAVAPIVEKSLQGFNGTVLCYGQTSSGKTHTMYGSEDEPGVIFLTAQDLFRRFGDDSRSYFMKIGLVEVYNEKLTDLLDPQKKQIDIKEVNGEAVPKDLREIDVYSPEDMLDAARRVQKERRIGETRMNKESSRSHTIIRIRIQSTPNDDSKDPQMTNALLNFVDLAGSEKADQSGAVGDRFREATYINKSLTTLSIVVNQLSGLPTPSYGNSNPTSSMTMMINTATGTHSAKQTSKQSFVSYRDSKLTRILQSSLSGNAYIALICNMTPASVEETHSTLRFASRAKCIEVDPTKNLGPVTASEYKSKIQDLEKQLNGKSAEADRLRKQLAAFTKFVRPNMDFCNSPAPFNAQLDRRRTMCPSMLFAHRTGILADHGPGDEFKVPKSPVRRSLMPTAANNPLPSIPPLAANNPPQRSLLDSSFEVNENFLLDEPGPPAAKLAKVDAQTWTEFSPLTALQFLPPKSPAPHKQLDRSVRFDPSQSMIDEIKEEKSFIALERACEVEELSKKCESLQAELEELRSSNERLHSENEFLQKSFSDTKSRSQKVMSDYERLQEENLSQAEFINEIKEEVSEYKKRLEESEEALREVKNGTIEDQEWRDRYEALRAENDSALKNLSEEKDELATRVEKLLVQLQVAEEVKTNLAEVTKLKDDLQQQVVSIGENLKATYCEKIQLEADLATANESLATLNESLATTNGSLATAMESLSTANKSLATAGESLGRLQQLEHQHQVLLEQHEALKTKATQLRQDNQDNRSERLKFEAEKDGLEIKYDKTLELLAVREKQLGEKSNAHDILLAELDTFESELLKATKINELSSEDFSRKLELLKREKDDIDEELINVQGERGNSNRIGYFQVEVIDSHVSPCWVREDMMFASETDLKIKHTDATNRTQLDSKFMKKVNSYKSSAFHRSRKQAATAKKDRDVLDEQIRNKKKPEEDDVQLHSPERQMQFSSGGEIENDVPDDDNVQPHTSETEMQTSSGGEIENDVPQEDNVGVDNVEGTGGIAENEPVNLTPPVAAIVKYVGEPEPQPDIQPPIKDQHDAPVQNGVNEEAVAAAEEERKARTRDLNLGRWNDHRKIHGSDVFVHELIMKFYRQQLADYEKEVKDGETNENASPVKHGILSAAECLLTVGKTLDAIMSNPVKREMAVNQINHLTVMASDSRAARFLYESLGDFVDTNYLEAIRLQEEELQHEELVAEGKEPKQLKGKRLYCYICRSKSTFTRQALDTHMKSYHIPMDRFKCDLKVPEVTDPEPLKKPIKKKRKKVRPGDKEKVKELPNCPFTCVLQSQLDSHKWKVHNVLEPLKRSKGVPKRPVVAPVNRKKRYIFKRQVFRDKFIPEHPTIPLKEHPVLKINYQRDFQKYHPKSNVKYVQGMSTDESEDDEPIAKKKKPAVGCELFCDGEDQSDNEEEAAKPKVKKPRVRKPKPNMITSDTEDEDVVQSTEEKEDDDVQGQDSSEDNDKEEEEIEEEEQQEVVLRKKRDIRNRRK